MDFEGKAVRRLLGVCLCVLSVSAGTALSQDEFHFGIGVGGALNAADVEGSRNIHGDGFHISFNGYLENGVLFRVSRSINTDDHGALANIDPCCPLVINLFDDLVRTDVSVGYIFRHDATFRPLLHGGVSFVTLEREADNGRIKIIDDSSRVPTLGGGFEIVKGRFGMYVDVNFDKEHVVDLKSGLGTAKFTLSEFYVGWLFRF